MAEQRKINTKKRATKVLNLPKGRSDPCGFFYFPQGTMKKQWEVKKKQQHHYTGEMQLVLNTNKHKNREVFVNESIG